VEDVPLLVEYTLSSLGFSKRFDESALRVLMSYRWPGNVRELRNVIERTCILTAGDAVTGRDLSFLNTPSSDRAHVERKPLVEVELDTDVLALKEMERRHIINVLKYVDGHKGKAARMLQINPKTLYYKMKNYNIISTYK
jgi:two-component system NtrC family response regulator